MNWKIFCQELGKRLKSARKDAGLTQNEIAKQINITRQYITQIENGKAENVSLNVILNYLDACKKDYPAFFTNLEKFIVKQEYNQIISKIDFPKDDKLRKKVVRDIDLYHSKIQGIRGKAKLLSKQVQHKAVVKFGNYRSKIEHIESLAYKVIGQSGISQTLNPFYRAYIRQLYKTLKNNFISGINLDNGLDTIISKWVNQGLKRDLLIKIKDVIIKYFEPIKQKEQNS